MWKAKCLSFGGRLTLIEAALNNLPFYYPYSEPQTVW